VWLRWQLTSSFPGALVPPLPPVDGTLENRFAPDFIARRQAGLELFLRRVAAHKLLSTSSDLVTFLEAKVWELQTVKNASKTPWYSSMLDSTEASMKRVAAALSTKTPDDDDVEKLRAFANEYFTVVSAAQTAHQSAVNGVAAQAEDLSHLGPAFDLLSQSERELSLPFNAMAKELDELRALFLAQVQAEHVSGLSSLLQFNAGMAASLKVALKNRARIRPPGPRPPPPLFTHRVVIAWRLTFWWRSVSLRRAVSFDPTQATKRSSSITRRRRCWIRARERARPGERAAQGNRRGRARAGAAATA
jgi:hypothetical protein